VGYTQKKVAAADKNFDNYSYVDAIAMKSSRRNKDEKCFKTRRLLFS
jgi:hypothetical protein